MVQSWNPSEFPGRHSHDQAFMECNKLLAQTWVDLSKSTRQPTKTTHVSAAMMLARKMSSKVELQLCWNCFFGERWDIWICVFGWFISDGTILNHQTTMWDDIFGTFSFSIFVANSKVGKNWRVFPYHSCGFYPLAYINTPGPRNPNSSLLKRFRFLCPQEAPCPICRKVVPILAVHVHNSHGPQHGRIDFFLCFVKMDTVLSMKKSVVECIFRKKKRVTSKPPGFTVILCQSFSGGSLFSNHGWKWFQMTQFPTWFHDEWVGGRYLCLRQIESKGFESCLGGI